MSDAEPPQGAAGFREQYRLARHRAFLDTAIRIVVAEGEAALTMQRVAEETGSAVGSIYRYFPSKDALIAEVQREALDVLHTSGLVGQSHLDDLIGERGTPAATAALARVAAAALFWIVGEDTYPSEIQLSRRLFVDPDVVVATEEATRILPAALRLLADGQRLLDEAAAVKALRPGNSVERAVVIISSLTGVVLTSKLGRWDASLFDGRRLGREHLLDLLAAWGATKARLGAALALVDEVESRGLLAPRVGGS